MLIEFNPLTERSEFNPVVGKLKTRRAIMNCLICESKDLKSVDFGQKGLFWVCDQCEYIFKDPKYQFDKEKERSRYLQHNNDLEDERYLKYLLKTFEKIQSHIIGTETILDYGCGPTKGLEKVLEETSHKVISFDPIFFPVNLRGLNGEVVFCSEVIEHSFNPQHVFQNWSQFLVKKGIITLRTSFHPGKHNLENWWYLDDPTHVGFFNETTFEWIAQKFGWNLLHIHNPYVSFQVF